MSSTNAILFLLECYGYNPSGHMPIELPITRLDLARLFADLGYRSGAEIGVESGEYSEALLSVNPDLHLIMVDPWKPYAGYREHVTKDKLHGFMLEAMERTSRYDRWVLRESSMDALAYVRDETLDFVYIDANHEFLHVAADIAGWERKVKRGGIVAGHDFARRKRAGYVNHVKDVVQAWTYSHSIRPWFICRGDRNPSWFWVKG